MVSDPLFFPSLWQAGRKTYAMVSSRSTSHSLASELVESNDGHEEIIKVGLVHFHGFSLLSFSLQTQERKRLPSPKGLVVWLGRTRSVILVLSCLSPGKILINTRRSQSGYGGSSATWHSAGEWMRWPFQVLIYCLYSCQLLKTVETGKKCVYGTFFFLIEIIFV